MTVASMALVAAATFAFRWLTLPTFHNDHFDHVARAQQVLLGAWPVRDFVDPGLPLTYLLSAAVQLLVGEPFLAEALLFATGFAIAAALSYKLAAAVSGSVLAGVFAVAVQVLAYPRSYNYPKLLVYAVAVAAGWWAIERLTVRRLAVLGASTAMAYYFRHDHGLYVGIGTVVLIATHLWPLGWPVVARALGVYAVFTAAFVAPHLAYVEWHSSLWAYFEHAREFSSAELGLSPMGLPWFAMQWIPGNSIPFLFWFFWTLPAACLLMLVRDRARQPQGDHIVPMMAMVIALAFAVNLGFIRVPLAVRLPDVVLPHTILGAWLLARLWRAPVGWPARLAMRPLLFGAAVGVALAVVTAFDTKEYLASIDLTRGAVSLATRWQLVTRELRQEPSGFMPNASRPLVPFLQYVRHCTSPQDRLMYVGYQPEVYVVAGRGFAGGHIIYAGRFHADPQQQALTVRRLTSERVPFVLVPAGMRSHFREVFPDVWRYVESHYRPLATVDPEGDPVDILIDASRTGPATIDRSTGWPCLERSMS